MSKHAWGAYVPFRNKGARAPYCTACGASLVDGIGVINGRFLRDALVCGPCGRLGVRCTCDRKVA